MSGNEVINPAMSKKDGTATSELLGENHGEGIDNDEKAPGNELASDSQSASKVVSGADEHAASSDQLDGPSTEKHAQVDTKPEPSHFRVKEDDSMSEGTEHFMSEEDDSMSEGTDISDEDLRKDLSWRRSKAPKPVKQFYDYIKLMEDRMTAMESQLQKAKLESTTATLKQGTEPSARILTNSGKEEPPLLSPPPPPRQLQLSIAHVTWDTSDEVKIFGSHVIGVLIGEPDYMKSHQRKRAAKDEEKKKDTEDKYKKTRDEEMKEDYESNQPRSASAGDKRSLLPERMIINSDLLVAILTDITSLNLRGPLVILRPFKVLIHWESEIFQRLERLESKWRELDALAEVAKTKSASASQSYPTGEPLTERDEGNTKGAQERDCLDAGETSVADKPMESATQKFELEDTAIEMGANKDNGNGKDPISANSPIEQPTNVDVTSAQAAEEPQTKASEQPTDRQDQLTDDIQADLRSLDGKPALRRLRLLAKFMNENLNGPLAKLKEGRRHQQVFFADLYHFFNPGDEVYKFHGSGADEQVQAYRVLQVTGGRRFNSLGGSRDEADTTGMLVKGSPLEITCIHIDFDGRELGPITTNFSIREYSGERSTVYLPVHPAAFTKDPEDLKRNLELRGQRFVELAQTTHKDYSGLTIDPIEDIDSQVIIDFDTTFQANPAWKPNLEIQYPPAGDPRETGPYLSTANLVANNFHGTNGAVLDSYENGHSFMYDEASIDQARMKDFMEDHTIFRREPPVLLRATQDGTELNNDDKRLLPPRVFGFVLRSRTWAALSIRLVKDLPRKPDGFEQLVLPPGHRDLVRALVRTHSRGSREEKEHQVDLVKGKGKGLIILLHGVPGVGKTSTAECIADYTQRPLFPITCGDIGETAAAVETNLGKSFQLAHKWGCVLLLDEADVFMAKRNGSDIQRNSLVSVFLRILEYYSGILFLTTNRVGIFDPAFKSRIHISLYYPPLDRNTTIKIWKVNIAKSKTSEKKYEIDEDEIIEFAEDHFNSRKGGRWNGRQIRNAFQTVLALAEYDAAEDLGRASSASEATKHPRPRPPRVTVDHFQKVASAASQFNQYLKDVYGGREEADRAYNEGLRKDDWAQEVVPQMRRPMRGGNSNQGYYPQPQYRQQQQRAYGRDMFHSEPPFEEADPFQESTHPALPNEVDNFSRPSPDPRNVTRVDRSGYSDLGGPPSSNLPSPWGGPRGHGPAARSQNLQDGRARTSGTANFEASGYKPELTDDYADFDDFDPRGMHGQGRN